MCGHYRTAPWLLSNTQPREYATVYRDPRFTIIPIKVFFCVRKTLITISHNFPEELLLYCLNRLIAIKLDQIILPNIFHCRRHITCKPIKPSLNFFPH